jgi:hypothetical protein
MPVPPEELPLQGLRRAAELGSCKDGFRYRVVEDGGRFRFDSVKAVDGIPCESGALERLLGLLEGAWLDEVDPAEVEALDCGRDGGCSRALAELVGELKEVLVQ